MPSTDHFGHLALVDSPSKRYIHDHNNYTIYFELMDWLLLLKRLDCSPFSGFRSGFSDKLPGALSRSSLVGRISYQVEIVSCCDNETVTCRLAPCLTSYEGLYVNFVWYEFCSAKMKCPPPPHLPWKLWRPEKGLQSSLFNSKSQSMSSK